MITIKVDTSRIQARLKRISDKTRNALVKTIGADSLELASHIKQELSGQVLNVVTGNLRRSVNASPVEVSGSSVKATVSTSSDVKYAAIHEFGGTIPPHDIFPDKAKALHFMAGGAEVFAKVVHSPGATMPERSFMRRGLADLREKIKSDIERAVKESARER